MGTAAVVYAISPQGGQTYWAGGVNEDGPYNTGTPKRPIISEGLRDALKSYETTWPPRNNRIIYWTPWTANLRSCISNGQSYGPENEAYSIFVDFIIQYVSSVPGEPSASSERGSNPRGLETLAKAAVGALLTAYADTGEFLENPYGAGFSKINNLLTNPEEFVKSSPLMHAARGLDAFLRGPGQQSESASDGDSQEIWTLPGEVIGQSVGVYSDNQVYNSSSGGGGSVGGSGESKADTLDRILKGIGNILDKFVSLPNEQKGPGSDIWDKLLGLKDFMGSIDDVLGKLLDIPKIVPETIDSLTDMSGFITSILGPLLAQLVDSISDSGNDVVKTSSEDSIDFSELIQALRGANEDDYLLAGLKPIGDSPYLAQLMEFINDPAKNAFIMGVPKYFPEDLREFGEE